MTREEAIKLLVNATYSEEWQGNEDLTIAHNMAIEALKTLDDFERAQIITGGRLNGRTFAYKRGLEDGKRKAIEQEPCEDCVSRAELKKWLDMNFSFGGALRKLELFDRLDKELPSVTPKGVTVTDFADKCRECGKQKKGKWVNKEKIMFPICSKCGLTSVEKYSFCPNCGVRMEE